MLLFIGGDSPSEKIHTETNFILDSGGFGAAAPAVYNAGTYARLAL